MTDPALATAVSTAGWGSTCALSAGVANCHAAAAAAAAAAASRQKPGLGHEHDNRSWLKDRESCSWVAARPSRAIRAGNARLRVGFMLQARPTFESVGAWKYWLSVENCSTRRRSSAMRPSAVPMARQSSQRGSPQGWRVYSQYCTAPARRPSAMSQRSALSSPSAIWLPRSTARLKASSKGWVSSGLRVGGHDGKGRMSKLR